MHSIAHRDSVNLCLQPHKGHTFSEGETNAGCFQGVHWLLMNVYVKQTFSLPKEVARREGI